MIDSESENMPAEDLVKTVNSVLNAFDVSKQKTPKRVLYLQQILTPYSLLYTLF